MHTLRWASQGRHITASTYSRELGARTVPSILPWSLTRIFTHPGHSSAIKSADKGPFRKKKILFVAISHQLLPNPPGPSIHRRRPLRRHRGDMIRLSVRMHGRPAPLLNCASPKECPPGHPRDACPVAPPLTNHALNALPETLCLTTPRHARHRPAPPPPGPQEPPPFWQRPSGLALRILRIHARRSEVTRGYTHGGSG